MDRIDIPDGPDALRLTLCPELTLRDLFAAYALAGQLANPAWRTGQGDEYQAAAEWSYEFADAMLAKRAEAKP